MLLSLPFNKYFFNIDYVPGTEGTEISEYRACSQEVQGWEWEEGITSEPTITLQGDEYCAGWSVCVGGKLRTL